MHILPLINTRKRSIYIHILKSVCFGSKCCILTLDRAVNQRCTCVKRKKKRKQVGVMKEYRKVPAAVELVGHRKARVRASLQTKGCGPQQPPVEQLQPRCGRSAAMVKNRNWVYIAVCPCLH